MAEDKIKLLPEIEQLTEKLLADPKSRVFAQLADAYRKCGMYDEAIDTAKKGLEVHPQYAVAHLILGRCYMAKKMYALAREEFELTVRNDPQNLVGYGLLAETYERQNMYPEAVKYYQMVLDLDPTNIDIAEKVENLKGAIRPTAAPEPIKVYQPVVALEPPAPAEVGLETPQEESSLLLPTSAVSQEALIIEPLYESSPGPSGSVKEPETKPETVKAEAQVMEEPVLPASDKEGVAGTKAEESSGSTATLAELYATQGHYEKAIEAYRELIAAEPENPAYKHRMDELLEKAFPEIGPEPVMEAPAAQIEAPPSEAKAEKPEEEQAVELTGMFAEMEKLAASPEPAPAKAEAPKLDSVFSLDAGQARVDEEPAAAALNALFAEEPQAPPSPAQPSPEQQTQAIPEPPAPAAPPAVPEKGEEEPKENAVSSFQAWLNSIQK